MSFGSPSVPTERSVRPGLPSLKMISASYPAAAALSALTAKSQEPRCASAMAGSAGAATKSPGSQPEVLLGSGVAGMTKSLVGTTGPEMSPLPEYSKIAVSSACSSGVSWVKVVSAVSRKNGNVNVCLRTV